MWDMAIDPLHFCGHLHGQGEFGDDFELSLRLLHNKLVEIPLWIKNQGEFQVDGRKWMLDVGIAWNDEEWRQAADLKDFLREAYAYLQPLSHQEGSIFTLSMEFSSPAGHWRLDPETTGLLSTLRIELDVWWRQGAPTGDESIPSGGSTS